MQHHLLYDGQTIRWNAQVFRATSGMPGFQSIAEQCNQRDAGPIPSGFYRVFLTDHGQAKANMDTCSLIPAWGIQTIPRGEQAKECEPNWANWGLIVSAWSLLMHKQKVIVRLLCVMAFIFMTPPKGSVMAVLK